MGVVGWRAWSDEKQVNVESQHSVSKRQVRIAELSLLPEHRRWEDIGCWSYDRRSGQIYWSIEIYAMHDLPTHTKPSCEQVLALYTPVSQLALKAALQQALEAGEAFELEVVLDAAGRAPSTILARGKPVFDGEQICGLKGTLEERPRPEPAVEQLREALNRVENLEYAINSTSLVYILDRQGRLIHANHLFCDISGQGPDSLYGKTLDQLDAGLHSAEFFSRIWRQLQTGEIWRGEISRPGRQSEVYWVESQILPIYDLQGRIEQFIGIETPITERKRAESRLLKLQQGLEGLNRLAADSRLTQADKIRQGLGLVLACLDLDTGTVSRIDSGRYEVLYAYSRHPDFCAPRAQSYPLSESFCAQVYQRRGLLHSDQLERPLGHPCYRGLPVAYQLGNLLEMHGLPFGTVTLLAFDAQPTLGEQELEFFALFSRWLASLLETQQLIGDLKKANAAKDRLLQVMAHDLRSPLSAIMSRIQLLIEDRHRPQPRLELDEALADMREISEQALSLMGTILDSRQPEMSEHPPLMLEIDLASWLEGVVSEHAPQAEAFELELKRHFVANTLVTLDPMLFRRVIDNLLTNALKFTPAGGSVEIGFCHGEIGLEIWIQDNGIGIPAARLGQLLDETWRLRRPGLRGETSYGLGLSVVQEIIRLHSGRLQVSSEEGRGSRFTIILPPAACGDSDLL